MTNAWFRMYAELLNDPKVQNLPPELFKFWVNLLCLACTNNGTLPTQEDVSFALRLPFHETKTAFHALEKVCLVVTDGETFQIPSWKKRQYKSDTSTERVKRFRKQNRNVTETAPEQIQNRADTEQKETTPVPPSPQRNGKSADDDVGFEKKPEAIAVPPTAAANGNGGMHAGPAKLEAAHTEFTEEAETIRQYIAKRLPKLARQNAGDIPGWLSAGLTFEEIIEVADDVIDRKSADIGSFKYLTTCMESVVLAKRERIEQHTRLRGKYAQPN